MIRWFAKIMLVFALLTAVGGQWALIQTAAWAGMFYSHVQSDSVAVALSKTFDGQHPCKLCLIVDNATKGTKKQDSKAPEPVKKLELFVETAIHAPMTTGSSKQAYGDLHEMLVLRGETPPGPPPKALI